MTERVALVTGVSRRIGIGAAVARRLAFTEAFTAGADGRLVLFSSGQRLGPMPGELAYAASKAAVENLTAQLAPLLMPRGITVNCVNPGPVDTGYLTGADHATVAAMFPGGRWGTPEQTARLVDWLCSADAGWITGQVIDSDFDLSRPDGPNLPGPPGGLHRRGHRRREPPRRERAHRTR